MGLTPRLRHDNTAPMKPFIARPLCVAAVVFVAACATAAYGPSNIRVGSTIDDVQRDMGSPTGRYALPQGGQRLEFARGPYGKHTFMVDVDAQGRVTNVQQVLTEANFNTIVGGMTRDELLMRLGRPTDVRSGGRQGGQVWSYRYDYTFCQWFQVSVIDDRVRDASYGPDPLCDRRFR
jgi:hypothetical protein